ncbi:MAG: hypothetical protein MJ095_08220 [Oscillospiraceae bacterium]|nr:hypothetical protein [Oscillospiraceae bacterium]
MENGYKYISPDIMYSGRFTALDADMFGEYERYNSEICISRIKKRKLVAGLLAFCGLNLGMVFSALYIAAAVFHVISLYVLLCLACAVYIYLLVSQIRKKRMNIVVNAAFPFVLMTAHPAYIILVGFNILLSYLIGSRWEELKKRDGYPYFVMLVVDSKEAVTDENGEKTSIVQSAYENQKAGQTAEPDEIEVRDTSVLDSIPASCTDYFENV